MKQAPSQPLPSLGAGLLPIWIEGTTGLCLLAALVSRQDSNAILWSQLKEQANFGHTYSSLDGANNCLLDMVLTDYVMLVIAKL